jgi:hypothetical protein
VCHCQDICLSCNVIHLGTGGLALTIEHCNVIGERLINASLLAALLMLRRHNTYSVDHIVAGRRGPH